MTSSTSPLPVIGAIAFVIGIAFSGLCSANPKLIASYSGGTITQDDLRAERQYGYPQRRERTLEADVQAIVARRVLADRLKALPASEQKECSKQFEFRNIEMTVLELKRRVSEQCRPDAATLRKYYDENIESFRRPRQWRVLNIFLRVPEGGSAEERLSIKKRIEGLLLRIENGEDFSELAQKESDSPTAIRGGRMGFVTTSRLIPPIAAVVEQLEPGEVSEIIETEDGFTILLCTEIYPARIVPFEKAQDGIEARLSSAAFEESWNSLNRTIERRLAPAVFPESAHEGQDDRPVLIARTAGRATRIDPAEFLQWGARRSGNKSSPQSFAEQDKMLRDLALALGQADEGRRIGITVDNGFQNRLTWESEKTAAECVMDYEVSSVLRPPTSSDIRATYTKRQNELVDPEKRNLEILRVVIRPPDPQGLFRKLNRIANAIRDGRTTLAEAAGELSNEGHEAEFEIVLEVPPIEIEALGRGVAKAVFAAEAGDLRGPIQEDRRLVLVRVVSVKPARQLTLEEATPRIRRHLEQIRMREARRQVSTEILADAGITFH